MLFLHQFSVSHPLRLLQSQSHSLVGFVFGIVALEVEHVAIALKCEDVTICFMGEMKPFVVKNPKDNSVVELITPMRTF